MMRPLRVLLFATVSCLSCYSASARLRRRRRLRPPRVCPSTFALPVLLLLSTRRALDYDPLFRCSSARLSLPPLRFHVAFLAIRAPSQDAFQPMAQVKEIRLARERGSKTSRGFAFVEFHTLGVARHVMKTTGAGESGSATGFLSIDGSSARLTWARESARSGPPPRFRGGGDDDDGNSGFEYAQEKAAKGSSHQGPKRTAFGVPEGFYPDKESGYYFNEESGYYFDADRKLYYHPSTQGWYQADPITGQLKEYVDPAVAAAAAAEAAAAAAAEAAAQKAAAEAAQAAEEAKRNAPTELVREEGQKVVLGLGVGKGLAKSKAKKPVGLFKQTLAALPDEEDEAEGAAEEAAPKKEEEVLVDWDQLICQLCKRKFKERAILQKHVDESALHRTNLAEWYAKEEQKEEAARAEADRKHAAVREKERARREAERSRSRSDERRDERRDGGRDERRDGGRDERRDAGRDERRDGGRDGDRGDRDGRAGRGGGGGARDERDRGRREEERGGRDRERRDDDARDGDRGGRGRSGFDGPPGRGFSDRAGPRRDFGDRGPPPGKGDGPPPRFDDRGGFDRGRGR
eukprot:Transcript_27505.p2 GENE.Transcript_27505~~Transcript_27505.p2  ORF type:complete len:576 (-),score=232.97 Transcript_27505:34-1761(-)